MKIDFYRKSAWIAAWCVALFLTAERGQAQVLFKFLGAPRTMAERSSASRSTATGRRSQNPRNGHHSRSDPGGRGANTRSLTHSLVPAITNSGDSGRLRLGCFAA